MPSQSSARANDQRAINELVRTFFTLFSNRGGARPRLDTLFDLCIPQAVISKCVSSPPEVFSLESFIAPRNALLSNGTLADFQEMETSQRTRVFGNIAQRVCTYSKSGTLDGVTFETRGVKVFQFVRSAEGWRISAVSWDDEREGFTPTLEMLGPSDASPERSTGSSTKHAAATDRRGRQRP